MQNQNNPGLNKDNLFKKPLTRMESKHAETDRVAREILDSEKAAAAAKTKRLRAARLERAELTDPIPATRKRQ